MIDKYHFEDKIRELALLNNIPLKKDMIEKMFPMFEYEDTSVFNQAIKDLINNPPSKFTYSVLKTTLNNHKTLPGMSVTHWNGTECEWCEHGLIFYKVKQPDGHLNSYVARCVKCRSYLAPSTPFYNGEYERIAK